MQALEPPRVHQVTPMMSPMHHPTTIRTKMTTAAARATIIKASRLILNRQKRKFTKIFMVTLLMPPPTEIPSRHHSLNNPLTVALIRLPASLKTHQRLSPLLPTHKRRGLTTVTHTEWLTTVIRSSQPLIAKMQPSLLLTVVTLTV